MHQSSVCMVVANLESNVLVGEVEPSWNSEFRGHSLDGKSACTSAHWHLHFLGFKQTHSERIMSLEWEVNHIYLTITDLDEWVSTQTWGKKRFKWLSVTCLLVWVPVFQKLLIHLDFHTHKHLHDLQRTLWKEKTIKGELFSGRKARGQSRMTRLAKGTERQYSLATAEAGRRPCLRPDADEILQQRPLY